MYFAFIQGKERTVFFFLIGTQSCVVTGIGAEGETGPQSAMMCPSAWIWPVVHFTLEEVNFLGKCSTSLSQIFQLQNGDNTELH